MHHPHYPHPPPHTHTHTHTHSHTPHPQSVREPGHVHCLVLPGVVRSIAGTFNYNKTCDGNTTSPIPRGSVSDSDALDPYYDPTPDRTTQPDLTPAERGVFSR
jgi:hypothetical protein